MEGTSEKVKILSAGAITAMLRRMAYEIYERNFAESKLVLSGIGPRGKFIADRIEAHLKEISPLQLLRLDILGSGSIIDDASRALLGASRRPSSTSHLDWTAARGGFRQRVCSRVAAADYGLRAGVW